MVALGFRWKPTPMCSVIASVVDKVLLDGVSCNAKSRAYWVTTRE